jgi:hypothetical protein
VRAFAMVMGRCALVRALERTCGLVEELESYVFWERKMVGGQS